MTGKNWPWPTKGSNLGMEAYAIERSYPKVGVGQIWKKYLKQLKNYAHLWKLKHCANADADMTLSDADDHVLVTT